MWYSIEYVDRENTLRSHFGHNLVETKIKAGRLYLIFEEDNGERYTNEVWLKSIKQFETAGKREEN